jgi:hypothetical protein
VGRQAVVDPRDLEGRVPPEAVIVEKGITKARPICETATCAAASTRVASRSLRIAKGVWRLK